MASEAISTKEPPLVTTKKSKFTVFLWLSLWLISLIFAAAGGGVVYALVFGGYGQTNVSMCVYANRQYTDKATFQATDGCNTCTCNSGDVYCTDMACDPNEVSPTGNEPVQPTVVDTGVVSPTNSNGNESSSSSTVTPTANSNTATINLGFCNNNSPAADWKLNIDGVQVLTTHSDATDQASIPRSNCKKSSTVITKQVVNMSITRQASTDTDTVNVLVDGNQHHYVYVFYSGGVLSIERYATEPTLID